MYVSLSVFLMYVLCISGFGSRRCGLFFYELGHSGSQDLKRGLNLQNWRDSVVIVSCFCRDSGVIVSCFSRNSGVIVSCFCRVSVVILA